MKKVYVVMHYCPGLDYQSVVRCFTNKERATAFINNIDNKCEYSWYQVELEDI